MEQSQKKYLYLVIGLIIVIGVIIAYFMLKLLGDPTEKDNVKPEEYATGAETIMALYTGVQGENGIYFHDSTLANGAKDYSYRYTGANPNNYVCFGSDAEECPENNLYRIIGVFDDDKDGVYQIKLIKNTSLGNYYWDELGENIWKTATINTNVLNGTYLNSLAKKYQNMIETHTWSVEGMEYSDTNTAKQYYDEELTYTTTYDGKIGLMYVSDYCFAAELTYWTCDYNNYREDSVDWLYIGYGEWTISRSSDATYGALFVNGVGFIGDNMVSDYHDYYYIGVRPTFYMKSDAVITGGMGTQSDPFRIN